MWADQPSQLVLANRLVLDQLGLFRAELSSSDRRSVVAAADAHPKGRFVALERNRLVELTWMTGSRR